MSTEVAHYFKDEDPSSIVDAHLEACVDLVGHLSGTLLNYPLFLQLYFNKDVFTGQTVDK
jgi:hypothetical protein